MNPAEIISNIKEIYQRMPVHRLLAMHMYRCASAAGWIHDRWSGPKVDRDTLIAYMLVHDLGNVVKSDFGENGLRDPVFLNPKGWERRKQETIERYGSDANTATGKMLDELHVCGTVRALVDRHSRNRRVLSGENTDWTSVIGEYADFRVGPFGVVTLKERVDDLRERYAGRGAAWLVEIRESENVRFAVEAALGKHIREPLEALSERAIEPYLMKYTKAG